MAKKTGASNDTMSREEMLARFNRIYSLFSELKDAMAHFNSSLKRLEYFADFIKQKIEFLKQNIEEFTEKVSSIDRKLSQHILQPAHAA